MSKKKAKTEYQKYESIFGKLKNALEKSPANIRKKII